MDSHPNTYHAVIVAPDGARMLWTLRPTAKLAKRAAKLTNLWDYAQTQGYKLDWVKEREKFTGRLQRRGNVAGRIAVRGFRT